jgi:hypothetical protein
MTKIEFRLKEKPILPTGGSVGPYFNYHTPNIPETFTKTQISNRGILQDSIIRDIIFLWVCWSHFTSSERERVLLGPLLKKKWELGGTRFINKACILHKNLLGTSGVMQVQSKLRRSKFSQMEEWGPKYEQVLLFSGLGVGLSPWSHGLNHCCIHNFFCW